MTGKVDFKGLAAAALGRAEQLLAIWLPDGHRVMGEWKSRNPMRADDREGSFSISLTKGIWKDFASDDGGADLVSLYAYLFCGDDQMVAARELADMLGMPEAMPPLEKGKKPRKAKPMAALPPPEKVAKPREVTKWAPVLPVPADAPPRPQAHEFRGVPDHLWEYRDGAGQLLGYVARFTTSDGGKEVLPLTFCRHAETHKTRWSWMAFPEPRPLYGLDRLAAKPDATVLIVEGEKCADAGAAELPDLVVMSWAGGGKAVDKADWSVLAGRKVMTWADCDSKRVKLTRAQVDGGMDPAAQPLLPEEKQPGVQAMAKVRELLTGVAARIWNVEIPAPGGEPDGWDIADMIADGTVGEALANHIRMHAQTWPPAEIVAADLPPDEQAPPPDDENPVDAAQANKETRIRLEPWRATLLWKKGDLDDCLANVFDILLNRREWAGVLAYDEFAQRVVKMKPPPYAGGEAGEWDASDDSRTAIWLTRNERITPSSARVAEAVEVLAKVHTMHPVCDMLRALAPHDQVVRLDTWLSDFLGVPDSAYVRLVGRFYLIGMIKRVMEPGCKFDYCLVLEGTQGKGKSTALAILGGEWYADTDLDLQNKDAMSALQGVWLHEFAELGSVARAEATKQKSFLSRQVDKYRPVYGRRDIKAPRQLVFAGTTNDWEWNKDPTGGRRFWPVRCDDDLNLEGLRAMRDQLLAEALAAYKAGEPCYPTHEQQRTLFDPEQLQRQQHEPLVDVLHDWVFEQVAPFSLATALIEGGKMDASKLTRDMTTRGGIALKALGCRRVEKRNGMTRYWYEPPERKGAMARSGMPAQQEPEAPHATF